MNQIRNSPQKCNDSVKVGAEIPTTPVIIKKAAIVAKPAITSRYNTAKPQDLAQNKIIKDFNSLNKIEDSKISEVSNEQSSLIGFSRVEEKSQSGVTKNYKFNTQNSLESDEKNKSSSVEPIIMNLRIKQPMIENIEKKRSNSVVQNISPKSNLGIKKTIEELNDFVMNMLGSNKEMSIASKEHNLFKDFSMNDNVLDIEYFDQNKTISNTSVSQK